MARAQGQDGVGKSTATTLAYRKVTMELLKRELPSLRQIGRTKARKLLRVAREEFQRAVDKHLTGKEADAWEQGVAFSLIRNFRSCRIASTIRVPALPSHFSGARALSPLFVWALMAFRILSVRVPAIVFVPELTVTGLSVFSRTVTQGTPK